MTFLQAKFVYDIVSEIIGALFWSHGIVSCCGYCIYFKEMYVVYVEICICLVWLVLCVYYSISVSCLANRIWRMTRNVWSASCAIFRQFGEIWLWFIFCYFPYVSTSYTQKMYIGTGFTVLWSWVFCLCAILIVVPF